MELTEQEMYLLTTMKAAGINQEAAVAVMLPLDIPQRMDMMEEYLRKHPKADEQELLAELIRIVRAIPRQENTTEAPPQTAAQVL